MACAPSKDSDQPGHPLSLIRVFAVCMKKAWVLSYQLSAQQRLWSAWASALIRLGGCPGSSESWLGTQSFCWFCHEAAHFVFTSRIEQRHQIGHQRYEPFQRTTRCTTATRLTILQTTLITSTTSSPLGLPLPPPLLVYLPGPSGRLCHHQQCPRDRGQSQGGGHSLHLPIWRIMITFR